MFSKFQRPLFLATLRKGVCLWQQGRVWRFFKCFLYFCARGALDAKFSLVHLSWRKLNGLSLSARLKEVTGNGRRAAPCRWRKADLG